MAIAPVRKFASCHFPPTAFVSAQWARNVRSLAMSMNVADHSESLRRHSPLVIVDGARIESVADSALLRPGKPS
jgi:hypothetical protein